MHRRRMAVLGGILLVSAASVAATTSRSANSPTYAVRRQVIAVYLGTTGTDAQSGMLQAVGEMRAALSRQATSSGREFIARGVSLEPSVDAGARHLALFGTFDEVSLGGNWTNLAVVRYLGGKMDSSRTARIPQVVLLEREVTQEPTSLLIGSEREIARFVGIDEIGTWVRRGAPLPR